MRLAEILLETEDIEAGRRAGRSAEGLAAKFGAEGQLLDIEKTCRPLDIGKNMGRRFLVPLKNLPTGYREAELFGEFIQVIFDDPVEVDDFTIDIVEDFHLGRLAEKEHGSATGEFLDITGMYSIFKERQKLLGQAAFATGPGEDWIVFHFL